MKQLRMNQTPLSLKIVLAIAVGQVLYLLISTGLGVASSMDKGTALVVAIFYLLIALTLVAGTLALWRGHRFGQPLVLVWQLFAFIIGIQSVLDGQLYFGVGVAILSGIAVLATCSKTTVEYVTVRNRLKQPGQDSKSSNR